MEVNRTGLTGGFFALPWCCIIPAIFSVLGLAGGAVFIVPVTFGTVYAHEPVFSLGPHTLYKGGIGVEIEAEVLSKSRVLQEGDKIDDPQNQKATRLVLPTEIIYGVTPALSVTARIPIVDRRFEKTMGGVRDKDRSKGLGDITLRSKFRFWKRDTLGVQQAAAVVFGIKLPTGDDEADLPLGTGSTDFLFGLTAGHEGRRLYAFGDIRYRLNTEANDLREGNVFFFPPGYKEFSIMSKFLDAMVVKVRHIDIPIPVY